MKVGPIHVIRDATFTRLSALNDLWHQMSAKLAAASEAGNPLAAQVLEQTHGLMHSPLAARMAVGWLADPPDPSDPAGREAARRVIAAYRKAMSEAAAPPAPSMWDRIAAGKRELFADLDRGDEAAVQAKLDRLFVTDLTWGLGQMDASHPEMIRTGRETHLHFRFTDTLVNLAEAIGAARVTAMMQAAPDHLQPLNKDLNALTDAIVERLGFDPSFPEVGSSYGFVAGDRKLTIDSLTHAYTARRLRQARANRVYELGGGYGCLALLSHRAGVPDYTVFDLPWVNVLQGYFLIRALPPGTVRLHGETGGAVSVLPYWALYAEPAGACDVLVNTDSLPEMGLATARGYLPHIRRVVRSHFLSINQEAKGAVPGVGEQNCVRELVEEAGGWTCAMRQRYWLRQGYVEEVFVPA